MSATNSKIAEFQDVIGVVLCGGASTRMGKDKSLLPIPRGGTYLSLAVARLLPICPRVVLAGSAYFAEQVRRQIPSAIGFALKSDRLLAIPDPIADRGPLSGLISGLEFAQRVGSSAALVTPVDMPHLTTGDLKSLASEFRDSPTLPAISTFDYQHLEPFVAVYPTTIIDELKDLLASSDRSLYRWLRRSPHKTHKLPQSSGSNMNSPGDLDPIELLADKLAPLPAETLALDQTVGRILRSPLTADRDSPAANVSAMDGYAIRARDATAGNILPVIGLSQPGNAPPECLDREGTVKVLTGAVVPASFDLVIRIEDVDEMNVSGESPSPEMFNSHHDSTSQIKLGDVKFDPGLNIRIRGENAAAGSIIIPSGTPLHAGHVAAAANFGYPELRVTRKVRVRILVTGDEVQEIHADVKPWQLRDSNGPTIASLLSIEPWIEVVSRERVPDNYTQLVDSIRKSLADADALLLTGGVSMGEFDYVPKACIEAGATRIFHKLPIRPGKPIFGAVGPSGQLVMGLPGNPVSAAIGTVRFAKPLMRKLAGSDVWLPPQPLVSLHDAGTKTIPLTWFRLVRLAADGRCSAVHSQGSGDLVSISHSMGFVELPPNEAGPGPWPMWRWHD